MDDSKKHPPAVGEAIHLPEEMRRGVFANQLIIAHSREEFVLDYVFRHSIGGNVVVSRVILTPEHAKRMLKALQENLQNYERSFGVIQDTPAAPPPPASRH